MRKNPGKSGGLIQFDLRQFGRFYGDLVKVFDLLKATKLTMNKLVDQNGKGILSPMGAAALKKMIKNTIDGVEGKAPLHFPDPHEDWVRVKTDHGYGFDTPWKFTAGVYKSVVATNRSGTHIVGIDRRARVPKVSMSGKRAGSISVETYAAAVEYGHGDLPARPLFRGVSIHFISTEVPELKKLVIDLFLKKKQVFEEYAGSSSAMGEMWGSSYGNIDVSQGMKPNSDFADAQLRDAQTHAGKAGWGKDDRGGRRGADKLSKAVLTKVDEFLVRRRIKPNDSPDLQEEYRKLGKK